MNGHRSPALLIGVATVLSRVAGAPISSGPVNVLFVAIDDLSPVLKSYGYPVAIAPNEGPLPKQVTFRS